MWVAAKDIRVGDFLIPLEEVVKSRDVVANYVVQFNGKIVYHLDEAVDINPIYKVTGPGTYLMRPNLTVSDIQAYVDEGLEVSRVD